MFQVVFLKHKDNIEKISQMHPRTEATLAHLQQVQWFSRVGIRDTETVEVFSSWYEALESCTSPEWEELCMEAVNQYRERLTERSLERFQRWNEIVVQLKPVIQTLVRQKTKQIVETNDLPNSFIDTVDWDILHLCMESEYADVYPPGFFASQAYWYIKGHFPCGWKGQFPDGKLLIY